MKIDFNDKKIFAQSHRLLFYLGIKTHSYTFFVIIKFERK